MWTCDEHNVSTACGHRDEHGAMRHAARRRRFQRLLAVSSCVLYMHVYMYMYMYM